jgi:CHAD domain-containing protein
VHLAHIGLMFASMRGEEPLAEAGLVLLGERLQKAAKEVKPAAKGDPDGVHDLRVAIRKIRAAVSVLEETILDEGALEKEDEKLSRLFSALGGVRDHDVLALGVKRNAKREKLDKKGTARLRDQLDDQGKRASKKLRALMRAEDPRRLLKKVRRKAKRAFAKAGPHGDDHRVLVRHFAPSVLLRRYEMVLAFEAIMPASVDELHRLRVAVKKLRYAVDFFGEALGRDAGHLDKSLQTAQDQLGDLHDHHVACEAVAKVEGKRPPKAKEKKALATLRRADAAEMKRLRATFTHTWKTIAHGAVATSLAHAILALVGRNGTRSPTRS